MTPHESHDWYDQGTIRRCRTCAAYSNLGSGYWPCPGPPRIKPREVTMSTIVVLFHVVDEFLAELRLDPPPSHVLRLTHCWRRRAGEPYRERFVVAGYVNSQGEVIHLDCLIGLDAGPGAPLTDQTDRKAREIVPEIEAVAREMRLSLRAGSYAPS